MTNSRHDSEYFRRRAAEVRAAAFCREGEAAEVAGDLALAYAALARRRAAAAASASEQAELTATLDA